MTAEASSPDANIELVRAGFGDFNAGDLDACVARAASDLVMNLAELPEPVYGRKAWRQGAELMKRAFPDLEADIQDIFAAQDRVAVRLIFRGTHSGEFLGVPATGRSIRYVSHEFYRLADGLIARGMDLLGHSHAHAPNQLTQHDAIVGPAHPAPTAAFRGPDRLSGHVRRRRKTPIGDLSSDPRTTSRSPAIRP
jgi:steroid delta-isomerase-like uncharacterized protein